MLLFHNSSTRLPKHAKKRNRKNPVSLGNAYIFLLEISFKQAFECNTVASLVTGHLVDGVVDGIQAVLLGADSQIELALGCAELAVNAPCQVLLGGSLHVGLQILAQQLSELGSVLSLFPGSLFPVQADLGVALAVGNAGHAQVHADLGALALEVGHQLLEDVLLVGIGDVGVVLDGLGVDAVLVLSGQLALFHDLELGTGDLAQGALEISGHLIGFVNITTNGADKLLHKYFLQNLIYYFYLMGDF